MTHIIKAPKPPRRGPTTHKLKTWPQFFAAISDGSKTFEVRKADRPFAVGDELLLQEYRPEAGYTGEALRRRISYVMDETSEFGFEGFVVLGLAEPVTPKPDPDVCTYGELEPWEWFSFPETPGILRQRVVVAHTNQEPPVGGCHMHAEGLALPCPRDIECSWGADEPVRRAHVSIVEHEEPGTHARADGPDDVYVGDGIDGITMVRADAETTLRQLAALLAQQASPESGEPRLEDDPLVRNLAADPEAMRRFNEEDPAGWSGDASPAPGLSMFDEGLVEDGELVECPVCEKLSAPGLCHAYPGHPLFAKPGNEEKPYCMTTEQGRAVHQALADSVELGDFVGMASPAEDRSKPAPGWLVLPRTKHFIVRHVGSWVAAFLIEADAIAWTWARHDAATKGGES